MCVIQFFVVTADGSRYCLSQISEGPDNMQVGQPRQPRQNIKRNSNFTSTASHNQLPFYSCYTHCHITVRLDYSYNTVSSFLACRLLTR